MARQTALSIAQSKTLVKEHASTYNVKMKGPELALRLCTKGLPADNGQNGVTDHLPYCYFGYSEDSRPDDSRALKFNSNGVKGYDYHIVLVLTCV